MLKSTKYDSKLIRVFEPRISLKDILSVAKTLKDNEISGTSNAVSEFELNLANYFERKFSVAVPNGSIALEVALNILNLKKGDEVIVPSFTIISCLSAIIRNGLKPVFCDVDIKTWNMTLDNVEKVRTSNTKAILMVHTYGLTADAIEIENYCKEKNIFLIEDAAEAHGQYVLNRKCGTFGDISTLSFYANKHLTTGEGGAILFNSEEHYQKAKKLTNLDFNNLQRFKHDNFYWNYRISGIQASLGTSQLKNIKKIIDNKIIQANFFNKHFENYQDFFQLPLIKNDLSDNHYWVYGLVLKQDNLREVITAMLLKKNIETRPFFWPLHLQNALKKYDFFDSSLKLANSEHIGKNGFYIPIGSHLSLKKQNYIAQNLIESLKKLA